MSKVIWILKVSKKPSSKEYRLMLRVTGIGLLILGFYTFIIRLIASLILLPYSPLRAGLTSTTVIIMLVVLAVLVGVLLMIFLRRRR
ncbi:MAG: protein translocase SEC61 complex subunit gamma [Thermoprotei archaeon]|nr:MAG: protein translocase SEC61 complex subunit gamma [Thermoprotei archaeon]